MRHCMLSNPDPFNLSGDMICARCIPLSRMYIIFPLPIGYHGSFMESCAKAILMPAHKLFTGSIRGVLDKCPGVLACVFRWACYKVHFALLEQTIILNA